MTEKIKAIYLKLLPWWIVISAGGGAYYLTDAYERAYGIKGASFDPESTGLAVMFLVFAWLSYRIWEAKRKL